MVAFFVGRRVVGRRAGPSDDPEAAFAPVAIALGSLVVIGLCVAAVIEGRIPNVWLLIASAGGVLFVVGGIRELQKGS